jgi:HK97 family phage prohead protease
MTQTTEIRAGAVSIREDGENSDGRTLEGTALVYGEPSGETKEYGAGEVFARGAFRHALATPRAVPFFNRHSGDMIGAVSFEDTDEALRYKGRLFDTPAAIAYREAVRAGIDGASIEFMPGVVQRSGTRTIHKSAKALVAIAGSHMPAYPSARVAVRQEGNMIETTEQPEVAAPDPRVQMREIATAAVTELRREWAEREVLTHTTDGDRAILACRSVAELWGLIDSDPGKYRDVYSRALADQITTNNPGVMASGGLGAVKGIIEQRRPAVNAWGREGLGGSGMSVDWPYFNGDLSTIVGEQAAQKTEITSVRVDLLKGTAAIKTYAGGSDASLQLLRRSDPSYKDAYVRILTAAYAVVTEAAFVNAIEATAGLTLTTITWASATEDQILAAMGAASSSILTKTGAPAEFGIAAPDVFLALLSKVKPVNATNAIGTGTAAGTLAPVISGIRIYQSAAVNAGQMLVSNESTASWHEDGPFQIEDDDVAKLGRNIAIWGMGATGVYFPSAIHRLAAT